MEPAPGWLVESPEPFIPATKASHKGKLPAMSALSLLGRVVPQTSDSAVDTVAQQTAPQSHRSTGRTIGAVAGGIGALAIGAAAAYLIRERTLEEPPYNAVLTDGDFALRHYGSFTTAQVVRSGALVPAMAEGYKPLFDYIAAREGGRAPGASTRRIATTTPVIVAPGGNTSARWFVRFPMPRDLARGALPRPQPQITLEDQPARRLAVITFSGKLTDELLVARKRAELERWVATHELTATGPAEYAAYNGPAVPGFLRRNEIWLPVGEG